ncbi:MAG: ImmA/IrrE family metallo-endopeptidase [Phycisphaerae bacterium]|nr:ImmA/IrrE family metallo-endopeptidase [Phycisphaerae bacterium]
MQLREVDITPKVAEWARTSAGLSREEAANRIGRPEEEIAAWESGERKPSMAQIRKACEVYKRPLAAFFLPEPPLDFAMLRDFRRLPADIPREYSPSLRFLVRHTRTRQEWLSDFLQSENHSPLDFIGSARPSADPLRLAAQIRERIGITPDEIRTCRTREDALNLWMSRSEANGIFVFRAGNLRWEKIEVIEARGFALSDPHAPFIFLNAQDAKAAQVFTLAHELVHLWLDESGVSNLRTAAKPSTQTEIVEVFCNRVAAAVLVPQDAFQERWKRGDTNTALEERIQSQSRYFKVSDWVIARRLLDWGQISKPKYDELTQDYDEQWREAKVRDKERQAEAEGGPSFYRLKLMNNGNAFSRVVLSAYESGSVSGRDASSLLGIKLDKIGNLAEMLGVPVGWRRGH